VQPTLLPVLSPFIPGRFRPHPSPFTPHPSPFTLLAPHPILFR
jgi:hypothetical protein